MWFPYWDFTFQDNVKHVALFAEAYHEGILWTFGIFEPATHFVHLLGLKFEGLEEVNISHQWCQHSSQLRGTSLISWLHQNGFNELELLLKAHLLNLWLASGFGGRALESESGHSSSLATLLRYSWLWVWLYHLSDDFWQLLNWSLLLFYFI